MRELLLDTYMLDTYASQKPSLICPKCNKKGFLTSRWVRSNYFVKHGSDHTLYPEYYFKLKDSNEEIPAFVKEQTLRNLVHVRVYEYTGRNFIHEDHYHRYEYAHKNETNGKISTVFIQTDESNTSIKIRKRLFEILGRKKVHYYIGHYDSKKYQEQMQKYKEGKIKSKPNGRKWCSINASELDLIRYKMKKHDYIESITIPA